MEDLKRLHREICQTFPQIAGVANGALILRDKTFANTDLESFQTVLRPKVDGTINLSELFNDNSLDFFIAFSSIVATMGNTGQSAYSAANSFLKSLIAQRRKQGLAGSVIDISRVLGVGYTERETKAQGKLTERVIKKIMNITLAMSESDLHQLFAEAVLAGRSNSGRNPELITGIRTLSSDMTNDVFWANNLKFSHFIQDLGDVPVGDGSKAARVPVKSQLLAAKSFDGMVKVLKGKSKYVESEYLERLANLHQML
jgi:NAD(P)-dependent dehydrogenase (short-subunit alcohol dehydrogenase family)